MGTEGDNVRVIAGRYRLEARLGRGGMGVVWRATDQLLGRQVAVKELALDETLSLEEARHQRERTLREARAVAQLSHPNVVVVHDVVEDDERPYLVMELIDGGSLAERIARNGPVDAAEAARIGLALLAALQKAHQAGVLHRDLKPANVLMEAGTGRVVLTDFGIAQVTGATTLTETGSFVGSPEYTSPERMSGDRTGPESDLWSLGALLCTVLSGESLFHRDSLGGVLHAVVMDDIRIPDAAAPLLPVVLGLLERDPDRRLTAAEAERMLRAYVDTGRTPHLPADHVPTQRDVPRHQGHHMPRPHVPRPHVPVPHASEPGPAKPRRSARTILAAAALAVAVVGAGVSAAALLMGGDGEGERAPGTSAPSPTGSPESPTPTVTVTRQQTETTTAPAAPAGYRIVKDPKGFSLAVPDGFKRNPQGSRVFYMSPGGTFRIGIKVADPEEGGPLEVMRRSHAKGPENNLGYRDGEVLATTHNGRPAALWEFTWDGFTEAEGARHTYDLCWEEGGRMYDVWVSAPVGRSDEAKRYFDTAVDSFVRAQ
ncbi:serine/threonine-protein kinase [Streptomyces himalayensis]|uniref:non-specific serine/threonine protein kinase n=1 Tax=Streptomyces himalayensis subsp. himalayensis TaxID=2756131 RepID=A0A7W0DNE0_9ACTN|nr:serine/threonine-protein kinase [Streptomyces himalayensis]MBA2948190.1 serine/threonine protein kinase [Streptomyces himalayensis subsp. himalayensis]